MGLTGPKRRNSLAKFPKKAKFKSNLPYILIHNNANGIQNHIGNSNSGNKFVEKR
jgi:hypothetical protein